MSKGWIKLHRDIQDHWLYGEKRTFSKYEAWLDLVMRANHRPNKIVLGNELIEVETGQLITSLRKLGEQWSWSNTKVNHFLTLLSNDGMITYKKDTKKTLITIVKYELYSGNETKKRTHKEHENDTEETQKHTNKKLENLRIKELEDKEQPEQQEDDQMNAFVFYENNFGGTLNSFTGQLIGEMVDEYGNEKVIEAMKVALSNGVRNMNYVNRVLVNQASKGEKQNAKHGRHLKVVGKSKSSTSKETERLEEVARRKGLSGQIRDTYCDF